MNPRPALRDGAARAAFPGCRPSQRRGASSSFAAGAPRFGWLKTRIDLPATPATHDWRRRWLGTPAYWACQFAGWGAVVLAMVAPLLFTGPGARPKALLLWVVFGGLGLAVSHLLRVVVIFLLRRPRSWPAFLLLWLPWAAVLACLATFLVLVTAEVIVATDPHFPIEAVQPWTLYEFLDNLNFYFPLLAVWTGFYLGLRLYRQHQQAQLDQARMEAAARESELRALKAQLNPHFLFNSLNSLRALMPLDQTRPRAAITQLAELLRASLASSQDPVIPLGRELETVENYLALEQLRHGDRLRWRMEIEPGARGAGVPPFLLQGLVENAVKHGIDRREEGGEIRIVARPERGGLTLLVANPGALGADSDSTGLGLANTRARLRLLFGAEATVALRQVSPALVEAEVFLPGGGAPKTNGSSP
jgi:hypothetical protein